MSKPVKRILTVLGGVAVLLIIAFVAVLMYINTIAKGAIERGGTSALGVPVTLQSASVGIFSGTFGMARLHIANPEGFQGDHFVKLGEGGVAVSLGTLFKDTVELPSLTMTGLSVRLEKDAGKSNYGIILDHLKKQQGPEKPKEAASGEKKFVVNELVLKDIHIHVELFDAPGPLGTILKPRGTFDIPIDEVRLTNIGKGGSVASINGVTMKELAGVVVQAVMDAAVARGGNILPAEILGELKGKLGDLRSLSSLGIGVATGALGEVTGAAGEALKGAGKVGEEVKKGLDEGAKKVEEGIKGLIPGKKNNK